MTNLDSVLKSRDITWPTKVCVVKAIVFYSGHVWLWDLNHKEGWALTNWCFWTVVLKKTLESPLDCKEIQPVHPKGNLSWIFIGRTDAEAETPMLWWLDANNWLIGKDPDGGKDWRQVEKGTTEGGWMASLTQWTWVWVNSGDGQGGLAYCSPWGCKELGTTERLNWKGIQTFLSPEVSMKVGESGQHCQKWCDWMKGKAFPPSVVSTNIHHFV